MSAERDGATATTSDTNNVGILAARNKYSLAVGPNGPVLLLPRP